MDNYVGKFFSECGETSARIKTHFDNGTALIMSAGKSETQQ